MKQSRPSLTIHSSCAIDVVFLWSKVLIIVSRIFGEKNTSLIEWLPETHLLDAYGKTLLNSVLLGATDEGTV